jgi:hypothetical protein
VTHRPKSQILRRLTAAEMELLLNWFVESYDDGWRPIMQSHQAEVSGRYEPVGTRALLDKAGQLLAEINGGTRR